MSALSTPSNNDKPRKRSWVWLILTGIVVITAILGGVYLVQTNGASAVSIAEDSLNFADVVITDLRQEEQFNGKLESIKGTGTVIPAVQIDLAFDIPGTVSELLVQVGEEVQAGDVLARLDTTDLERAVAQAEISLRQVEISLEIALKPPTETQIQVTRDVVDQAVDALNLAQINQESAVNSTLVTQSLPDARDNYQARLSDYNGWVDNYNSGKSTYWYVDQAQQALEDAEHNLTSIELMIEQMTQSANNNLAQAVDQYNQAKASLDSLLTGVDAFAVESLKLQVQAASLNLEMVQEDLAEAILLAPFDGVITTLMMIVGQNVDGGTPVINLADLSHPTLEILLGETNLDKVALGTGVEVRFSALPSEQFTGAIVLIDPQLNVSSNYLSFLRVLVQLDSDLDRVLPAGLTASVNVVNASNRIVRAFLPLDEEGLLAVGDPVFVELPDFSEVSGTVVFVPQTPTAPSYGPATFHVLVEIDDPAEVAALAELPDETSVDVIFVSDAVEDVMAIPVSALLALLEGGYGVEKKIGLGQIQLIAVEVGFFGSNNMIAVTSEALQPGDQVVVP